MQGVVFRCPQRRRVVREGILRLRDDDWEFIPAVVLDVLQVLLRLGAILDVGGTVDFLGDGLDGLLDALCWVVELVGCAVLQVVDERLSKLLCAFAALAPDVCLGESNTEVLSPRAHELTLGVGIGEEGIQSDNWA